MASFNLHSLCYKGLYLNKLERCYKKNQAGRKQAVEETRIYGMSLSPLATRETKSVEWGT